MNVTWKFTLVIKCLDYALTHTVPISVDAKKVSKEMELIAKVSKL